MKKIIATAALTAALASGQAMAMSSAPETGYTETRYPIVLVHGFLGFDSVLGIEYFYKVAETLQEDGADVYTVSVSNTNFPEYRAVTRPRAEYALSLVKLILLRIENNWI